MTECERIVKEGIVPEDFLKEETRCDFFVDSTRKKLWAILLDLYLEFERVCKKLGLRYFVTGGTLLGAIRHKGFIPWDDDFDVGMMREDFEILKKNYKEFRHPYFLQTPYTDPESFFSFAKLRNDNTTFCSEVFSLQGMHAGVLLDIYPIDYAVRKKTKLIYEIVKMLNLENSTYMRMKNPWLSQKDQDRVKNWKKIDPLIAYEEIQHLASGATKDEADCLSNAVDTIAKYGNDIYSKDALDTMIEVNFENIKVMVPSTYDTLLKGFYGNYMEFPPVEERGTWHSGYIIDPDTPYREGLKKYWEKIHPTSNKC